MYPREHGSILFCTTGIILNKLRCNFTLSDVSHMVLDEVHERDLFTDSLVTVMREVLEKNPTLKLILMSATLDLGKFSKYFNHCPVIEIVGRLFNVRQMFLEDIIDMVNVGASTVKCSESKAIMERAKYRAKFGPEKADLVLKFEEVDDIDVDLVARVTKYLHLNKPIENGAILVFLPGWSSIEQIWELLSEERSENGTLNQHYIGYNTQIMTLHSQMPMDQQFEVYLPVGPGQRKVILSTNLAETSITIEDVAYVVDAGRANVTHFDANANVSVLKLEWITKSSVEQRKGRAGRVQNGESYHLFSSLKFSELKQRPIPDVLRRQLEETILDVKSLGLGKDIQLFFAQMMDKPPVMNVKRALELLLKIRALDQEEKLTILGLHLSMIPIPPQLGKMVIFAAATKSLAPILAAACLISEGASPFAINGKNRKKVNSFKMQFAKNSESDFLMLANIMKEYRSTQKSYQFCEQYSLNDRVLSAAREMMYVISRKLHDLKLMAQKSPFNKVNNVNSHDNTILRRAIAFGLFPNISRIKPNPPPRRRDYAILQPMDPLVGVGTDQFVAKKSVNGSQGQFFCGQYMAYFFAQRNQRGKIQLQDSTVINEAAFEESSSHKTHRDIEHRLIHENMSDRVRKLLGELDISGNRMRLVELRN